MDAKKLAHHETYRSTEETAGVSPGSGRGGLAADEPCQQCHSCWGVYLAKGLEEAGKGFECSRPALVFRAMRDLADDDRRAQVPLGAVVGGLHSLLGVRPRNILGKPAS